MSRLKWLTALAAAGSLSAGVAVGASTSAETTPVTADFRAEIASVSQRQCDPNHVLFRLTFEGTQTSSDPRLAGDVSARVRSVVNITNGWGQTAAKVVVRDATTGGVKARANLFGVIAPDGSVEGVYVGHTTGPNSARLVANFNANQNPTTGAVTGEIGKDSQTGALQDAAVLTNACKADDDNGDDDTGDDD
jgi:hypothetical protein